MQERLKMGSIIKRHGSWHWRYYENSKQRSVKLVDVSDQYRSKKDVIPLANAEASRIAPSADTPAAGKTRVVEFTESVFLPWVQSERKPATYDGYRKLWQGHLRDHFGAMLLRECQPHHATEFLTKLAKGGMGRYSISHVRALMSGIFAHAVARGFLSVNPIHDCKVLVSPKPPAEAPHYTVEEMRAILAGLRSIPQALVTMALCFVGLNRAEIRGVRWDDVDLAHGVIRVRRSVWGKNHVSEGGKSSRRKRDVTIGPVLVGILETFRAKYPSASGYVLENATGHPLELGQFSTRTIRPALKKLGLEWKGYHAGRRGAETEMNRFTNGNSQITMHHFGHSKEVADQHYVKPLPEETRRAALLLDGALASEGQQGTAKS